MEKKERMEDKSIFRRALLLNWSRDDSVRTSVRTSARASVKTGVVASFDARFGVGNRLINELIVPNFSINVLCPMFVRCCRLLFISTAYGTL